MSLPVTLESPSDSTLQSTLNATYLSPPSFFPASFHRPSLFPFLDSVDSIRGFTHAAGFAAAQRCSRFLHLLKHVRPQRFKQPNWHERSLTSLSFYRLQHISHQYSDVWNLSGQWETNSTTTTTTTTTTLHYITLHYITSYLKWPK